MNDDTCPFCKANLQGNPIAEEHLEHYGGKTHYSRIIGIYDRERDMTVAWQCPECKKQWDRFTGKEIET